VAKLGDLDRLFEQIQRDKGKLDIIFANAGIASYASLGTIDEAQSRRLDGSRPGSTEGPRFHGAAGPIGQR
jgi:NAD(P)-dependent dehydrogenase (short-subunit alcohol dehydrogenase family)